MSQVHAHTARSVRRFPSSLRRSRSLRIDRRLPFDPAKPLDDKAQDFAGWWQRMHRKRNGLIVVKLKPVVFPDDKTGQPARFVWEVCKWPRFGGFDWMFLCWMIDGVGLWSKEFPTKKAALDYFRSAPEVVMERESATAAAVPELPAHTATLSAANAP